MAANNIDISCCEAPSSNSNIIENERSNIESEHQDLTDEVAGLPYFDFTNEKGNVRVKVRKQLRDEMLGRLDAVFATHPHNKKKNVNGGFSLCLGIDRRTGKNIWAHIEMTVNDKAPNVDSWSGRERVEYEVPKLFWYGVEIYIYSPPLFMRRRRLEDVR